MEEIKNMVLTKKNEFKYINNDWAAATAAFDSKNENKMNLYCYYNIHNNKCASFRFKPPMPMLLPLSKVEHGIYDKSKKHHNLSTDEELIDKKKSFES